MLLYNMCFGRSDPIPAENTWTYQLQAMISAILRRLPKRLGVEAITSGVVEEITEAGNEVEVDGDAHSSNHFKVARRPLALNHRIVIPS